MPNPQTTAKVAPTVTYPVPNMSQVSQKSSNLRQGKVPVGLNVNIANNTLKGTPLRKTVSSGWPTSNTGYY